MLTPKLVYAFQLDDQLIFDNKIGEVVAYRAAFVENGTMHLRVSVKALRLQLVQQGALVHFLKKTSAQDVGDFNGSSDNFSRQFV